MIDQSHKMKETILTANNVKNRSSFLHKYLKVHINGSNVNIFIPSLTDFSTLTVS
jgi:hypothetical protein